MTSVRPARIRLASRAATPDHIARAGDARSGHDDRGVVPDNDAVGECNIAIAGRIKSRRANGRAAGLVGGRNQGHVAYREIATV